MSNRLAGQTSSEPRGDGLCRFAAVGAVTRGPEPPTHSPEPQPYLNFALLCRSSLSALAILRSSRSQLTRSAFIETNRVVRARGEIRYLLRLNQRSSTTTLTMGTAMISATRLILVCLASSLFRLGFDASYGTSSGSPSRMESKV